MTQKTEQQEQARSPQTLTLALCLPLSFVLFLAQFFLFISSISNQLTHLPRLVKFKLQVSVEPLRKCHVMHGVPSHVACLFETAEKMLRVLCCAPEST